MSYDPKKDKTVKVDDTPACWTLDVGDDKIEVAVKRYAGGPPQVAFTKLGDEPKALRRQTAAIAVAIAKCITKNAATIIEACAPDDASDEVATPAEDEPAPKSKKKTPKDPAATR